MKIKEVKEATKGLTFVSCVWKRDVGEYRITYRGLKPQRAEDMAAYTDDGEDAVGTAMTMENSYWTQVFDDDKLPETRLRDAALRTTMGIA